MRISGLKINTNCSKLTSNRLHRKAPYSDAMNVMVHIVPGSAEAPHCVAQDNQMHSVQLACDT